MKRAKAAAVLAVLAVGGFAASQMSEVYDQAASNTASTRAEVAQESQGEVIRAAARLREMGVSVDDAVLSMAERTKAPPQAVQALVAQRWSRNRTDARQRYGRVGVLAASANVAAVEAALSAVWCEALTDPRPDGGPPHPHYEACLASAPVLSERLCKGLNVEVGRGARWQALPGDRVLIAERSQQAGGIYVEGPGYDEGNQAFDDAVTAQGWVRCEATP